MADQREGMSGRAGARYNRHDEAFWRKRLNHEPPVTPPMAVTADTAFIAAATTALPNVLPASDPAPSKSRDQVVVTLGGARIEMAGVHAERIVRFVLGQLGGGRC